MTFRFEMIKLQSFETRRALVRLKFFEVVKCVAILKIPIESRHMVRLGFARAELLENWESSRIARPLASYCTKRIQAYKLEFHR